MKAMERGYDVYHTLRQTLESGWEVLARQPAVPVLAECAGRLHLAPDTQCAGGKILLRELRRITAYAHEHEDDFVQLVTRQSEKELNRQLRDSNRELAQAEARIQKLDVIMQRLYEDNVDGKISDERFARMAKTYEDEQRQLESRKVELDAFIATAKEQRLSVDSFLDMVRKYTDITELTAEIIRTFVEKIEVMKPEKVPGTRTKKQTIVIHWNFIGAVEIPDTKEKTA